MRCKTGHSCSGNVHIPRNRRGPACGLHALPGCARMRQHIHLIMKTLVLALFVALLSLPAAAVNRLLPANIMAGTIRSVDGNVVTFSKSNSSLLRSVVALLIDNGQTYTVAPGLRIFDTNHRFLLAGQLPTLVGQNVGITLDMQGNVNRVWVLTDEEIARLQALQEQDSTQ